MGKRVGTGGVLAFETITARIDGMRFEPASITD
jgi:hypothetical protein